MVCIFVSPQNSRVEALTPSGWYVEVRPLGGDLIWVTGAVSRCGGTDALKRARREPSPLSTVHGIQEESDPGTDQAGVMHSDSPESEK